jgi:hypothetical protein
MGYKPLNSGDRDRLAAARSWLKGHFTHDADAKYGSVEAKLRLLEAILDAGWVEPHETWKLQALGIGFGDALEQELGLKWAAVEDSDGRDPALAWPSTTLLCFPLTMISKRVETGERVDVVELFAKTAATLRAAAASGRYG